MEKHHHRFLLFSLLAMVLGGTLAAVGFWSYWNFYARFRPATITKNQAEIQRMLDEADWVSPGRTGPALYVIAYRDCDACTSYMAEEFPKLAAANVDTRVILFARPDRQGLAQSTAPERATVAELWINRDWNLFARWMATSHRDWTAADLKGADRDMARRAVVNASRDFATQLYPLVKTSNLGDGYPLLIWRDHDGYLKACSCTDKRSYHFVRSDFGAPAKAPDFAPVFPPPVAAPASAPASTPPASAPASAPASQPASSQPASAPASSPPAPASTPPASAPAPVHVPSLAGAPPKAPLSAPQKPDGGDKD